MLYLTVCYNKNMEITKTRSINNLMKYEAMLKPNRRADFFMRLAGLISKKEAGKMLASVKKTRAEWR